MWSLFEGSSLILGRCLFESWTRQRIVLTMVLLTSFDFDYISGSRRFFGGSAQNLFSLKCGAYFGGSEVIIDGHNVHHISIISGQLLLQN